ncbi:MAG: hypothetical protein IKQ49_05505 [Eubacterium sp.]|nr:hypothetical protein [Eubacterium sp.]
MSRRKIRRIIIAVSFFYIIVAVLSIVMLDRDQFVIAGKNEAATDEETTAVKTDIDLSLPTESSTQDDTDAPTEEVTVTSAPVEEQTEALTGKPTVASTETDTLTEEPTDAPTETDALTEEPTDTSMETDTLTEEPTDASTEDPTNEPTDAPTEEGTEEVVEIVPNTNGKYYLFETVNEGRLLMMREYGSKNAKTINQLRPHSVGVLIELGDEWSRIYANGSIGYSITEALEIREVTKEEYEEQVRISSLQDGGAQDGAR